MGLVCVLAASLSIQLPVIGWEEDHSNAWVPAIHAGKQAALLQPFEE